MRLPFLRSSPAARSTSNTAKRKVLLAGVLGGVDTTAGSLAGLRGDSSPHERDARAYIGPAQGYNTLVSAASPPPDPPSSERSARLRVLRLEAGGILII